MNTVRVLIKSFLFSLVTLLLAPFYFLILFAGYKWRRIIGPELVRFYSLICLRIFRVSVSLVQPGIISGAIEKGMLIVSNHSSFLDIFVLSSLFGSVFVSKADVKYYPVIGQIAWLMGVVFLDRNSSKEKFRLIKKLGCVCAKNRVVVFPQGTTSRIKDNLPFNRGIFKAVELTPGISILPVSVRYADDSEIAWHVPQTLKENGGLVLGRKRIDVEVIVHEPVTADRYNENNAAQICRIVEETVLKPLQEKTEKG